MTISANAYDSYFQNLIKGDKMGCMQIVDDLISNQTNIEEIYTGLFQHALYQVGEYWELNKISVATEHLATAITENMMIRLQPKLFMTDRNGKKAVIACVANEHHQVGAKMIADIFEMNGWDGYFIGANTPVAELLRFVDSQEPDLLGLSLSIYSNLPKLISSIEQIRKSYPDLTILTGGQAFRWGGIEVVKQFDHIEYLSGIHTLQCYINKTHE
jgi:MerR family transcriptional regulator, light-induced transcriptional regulator